MIALPVGPQGGTTLVTRFVPLDAIVELSDYAWGTVVLSAAVVPTSPTPGNLRPGPMWRLLLAVPR